MTASKSTIDRHEVSAEIGFGPIVTIMVNGTLAYCDLGPTAHNRADAFLLRHRLTPVEDKHTEFRSRLTKYVAGEWDAFRDLPVRPLSGTPFQLECWEALRKLPGGTLETYGRMAELIGRPAAVRAVGGAIGSNPMSLVIPCHRVVGANTRLTGFGCGLPIKRALLRHEGWLIDGQDRVTGRGQEALAL